MGSMLGVFRLSDTVKMLGFTDVWFRCGESMSEKRNKQVIEALIFSVLIALGMFLWQGRFGFNLWDEGHLWYGTQRVLAGDVPIRDFRSYDPGRYYWSAAWMALWKNDGILALRASVMLFLIPGLWAGLSLISRVKKRGSPLFFILSALILSVWLFPRHKLFDISACLLLTASLAKLIGNPSFRQWGLYGITVGLATFLGRNHGLYGFSGGILAVVYLSACSGIRRGWIKTALFWGGGFAVGVLPFFILFTVPGFLASFWESLLFSGKTVLSIPVPWPWTVNVEEVAAGVAIRQIFIGLLFVLFPLCAIAGICLLLRSVREKKAVPPALTASVLMILPYAHYAFSRADINHLAQGVFPLLFGILIGLAMLPGRWKWTGGVCLFAISLTVMLPVNPGWQGRNDATWAEKNIGGDRLRVSPFVASDVEILEKLVQEYAPEGRSFVVVPYWPGAYALTRRRAPMYDVFPLFERTKEFQRKEIERIRERDPAFVVVIDWPLDGMESRCFRNTNPLVMGYIRNNFEPVDGYPYQVYRAR